MDRTIDRLESKYVPSPYQFYNPGVLREGLIAEVVWETFSGSFHLPPSDLRPQTIWDLGANFIKHSLQRSTVELAGAGN